MNEIKALLKESIRFLEIELISLPFAVADMISMSLLIIFGILTNNIEIGCILGLGALSLSNEDIKKKFSENCKSILVTILVSTLAVFLSINIYNTGNAKQVLIPLLVFIVNFAGGINKDNIRLSTQFCIRFMIVLSLSAEAKTIWAIPLIFVVGCAITFILMIIAFFIIKITNNNLLDGIRPEKTDTIKQCIYKCKQSLKNIPDWAYSIKVTMCIIVAEIINIFWKSEHNNWILTTIVMITNREGNKMLLKTVQRFTGTLLGILFAYIVTLTDLSITVQEIILTLVATTGILFRNINYSIVTATRISFVLMLLGINHISEARVFRDRIIATAIGGLIVIVLSCISQLNRDERILKEKIVKRQNWLNKKY
jgi:hypothetical protein